MTSFSVAISICTHKNLPCGVITLQWRHNGRDVVSNHQPHHCLLNRLFRRLGCLLKHLFRRRLKKTSKCRVTGLCAGNSPVSGEFPEQMASNAEMVPFDDAIMYLSYHTQGVCLLYTLGSALLDSQLSWTNMTRWYQVIQLVIDRY